MNETGISDIRGRRGDPRMNRVGPIVSVWTWTGPDSKNKKFSSFKGELVKHSIRR